MKISGLAIDGYGRLSQRTVSFAPGLQVIFGLNEQGKSTLRSFIGDMLFGQKRSPIQRVYEDSNELRCPWTHPELYGGQMTYILDDGREIEVSRRFDRKNETVQVFDRTHAREVTGQFGHLRNREPLFAAAHLGLSKDVFLNTATITHFTLDTLGDAEALTQLREKILALADSGEEWSSAEAALKRLEARITTIGQAAARTRPLPLARAHLLELQRELDQTRALRQDLELIEARRRDLLGEIAVLRDRRAALERGLEVLTHRDRVDRVREAQNLNARIDAATQHCFGLSGVRDFPLESTPEVQRLATLAATARIQCERTDSERAELARQLAAEQERLGEGATRAFEEIPEEFDQQLAELGAKIQRLRDRLDDIETARDASANRRQTAESDLAALPKFSDLADDPITWLNELANAFRIAVRSRDEEAEKRGVLSDQVERLRRAMAEPAGIFAQCPDFPAAAREYEARMRTQQERIAQLRTGMEALETEAEEHAGRVPDLTWLSVLTTALFAGLLIVAVSVGNAAIYVPAVPTGLAALYFLGSMTYARRRRTRAVEQVADCERKILEIEQAEDEPSKLIERLIVDAGCQTLRELEGRYEQFHNAESTLESLEKNLVQQETSARESVERVSHLFARYRDTFRELGEDLGTEAEVDEAALRATGRYQAYRDAKRRLAENKDQIKKHDDDAARAREELAASLDEERRRALEVRRLMRENGYPEESKHDNVLTALRSFRIRTAQLREKRGRVSVVQEKLAKLEPQLEIERHDVQRHDECLARALADGHCETLAQWQERAEQARQYRELRQEIAALQEQLRITLRGQDLKELQGQAGADASSEETTPLSETELKRQLDAVQEALDARMNEEHSMHLTLTERAAGMRSLSEIEEDSAATQQQIRDLEFELEAASHAMALIEEIARDRHAQVAPRLAALAGEFLKEITGGIYDELLISRDLDISIRIPQTRLLTESPENVLSKGTVDQIYLALRLAMVQCLSENGETLPLLLDDPFGNYDDARLQQTLNLLTRLAARNQILLFTCREDVVRAAQALDVPVLNL